MVRWTRSAGMPAREPTADDTRFGRDGAGRRRIPPRGAPSLALVAGPALPGLRSVHRLSDVPVVQA